MVTQPELETIRRALDRLSQAARADMQGVWDSLPTSERLYVSKALQRGWEWVLERYGNVAATLAADYFEVQARELRITPRVLLARPMDDARATARLGWAVTTNNPVGNLMVLTDELVKQPYRSTFQNSAHASGAGWARVPAGAETCNWCLMLASRGGVYHSKELAQFGTNGKKYHGDCDCQPVLVRGPEDYPEGYDPGGLYDQYQQARRDAGSGDPNAIVAAMRQRFGGN